MTVKTVSGLVEVVRLLVVDEVAARLPERLPRADDALGFALDLEAHLSGDEVAEDGPGWRCGGLPALPGGSVTSTVVTSAGPGTCSTFAWDRTSILGSVSLTAFSFD